MIGLIIKDFINLKRSITMFVIISVLYFFLGITLDDPYFITGILSVLLAISTVSLFTYDDTVKWDAFALTMPLTKSKIMQARYLMMILLTLIGAAFSSVLTIAVNIYLKKGSLFEGFQGICYGSSIILLMLSIVLPFVVKLGVERARLIFVALYIVPLLVVMLIKKLIENGKGELPAWIIDAGKYIIENFILVAPFIVAIVIIASYLISISIYKKKEI